MDVTKPAENEIVLEKRFGAPREHVFRALTHADEITQWMRPSAMALVGCEVDLRVGGTLRYVFQRPSGHKIEVRGVFEEVRAPSRFVYVETYDFSPLQIHVTTDLKVVDEATLLTQTLVYASNADRDADFAGVAESGAEVFANLERYLANAGQ